VRHALRADYDLVHVHKTDAVFAVPFLARRFACLATSHERAYLNSKWSWLGRLYFRLAERVFVRAGHARTCVSQEQQEYYRARYGAEVEHVPNGVEELVFDEAAAAARQAAAEVADGYVLFAARRVIPLKGLHHLLAALARVEFRGTLVVLGDLAQMPEYSAELARAARGLDVRFLGYVSARPELLALVRRASLFVFPSEREGMSIMLLEAAAVGTPILCSDIRANTDVLGAEEALFFRSADVASLTERFAFARAQPDELAARAARARAGVAQRNSTSAVAARYAALYERLLAARGRP